MIDKDTTDHEWLHLLADAMEEDIAGIERLEVNGYMCGRLRQIAERMSNNEARLDQAVETMMDEFPIPTPDSICPQCGHTYAYRACGPSHAAVAATFDDEEEE